ncbi:5,6-dimethylbenzimidazole synthase [Shewanella chilikensis]|uniref:5,6-dimethylbenzimidazole synthase n=1 Tax=Shewanella chilikensis TaxID=558541 RepID=UPI001CF9419B|nr:5,6-dimethylbenzimidazole synthase [Shewanella chilikensis]MCE9850745.1 5,6-dimethylbenzimidazole synthase [Shewanella chilikensis]
MSDFTVSSEAQAFSLQEREALYKAIFARRDVRSQFLSKPVAEDSLQRILDAAHHAPSVGFMQPWDFILVRSNAKRQAIKEGFDAANARSAEQFNGERRRHYQRLKLEGIVEAPLGICVTCDPSRTGPVVLGRTIKPEMDNYSAVCAVQNLWLAARAEGLGVGWVSILDDEVLRETLGIPEQIRIIAYLCLGRVSTFSDTPELERKGWLPRRPLALAIHEDGWQATQQQQTEQLLAEYLHEKGYE